MLQAIGYGPPGSFRRFVNFVYLVCLVYLVYLVYLVIEFIGFVGLISGAEVIEQSRNDHQCFLRLFEERGRHSELSERPPQVAPLALSLWSVTLTSPSLIRLRVEALRNSTLTGSPSSP